MTTATRCDQCNKTMPPTPVGWLKIEHNTIGTSITVDEADKDFCSWPCLAQYAKVQTG